MIAQMRALLLERRKVLAVAHSQGNLFLNEVYDRVKPSLTAESLRTVHVAPASATVRGPYVLNSKDLVIGASRPASGSPRHRMWTFLSDPGRISVATSCWRPT